MICELLCPIMCTQADFVLFVVSDGFSQDVSSSCVSSGSRCAVIHYTFDLMRYEYVHNGCRHVRSVPVLLRDANFAGVPLWLRNTRLYVWPREYKELFKLFNSRREQLGYSSK